MDAISGHSSSLQPSERLIDSGFDPDAFLRRNSAGKYLKEKYHFGTASTLAKLAMNGDGPQFYKKGARVALYRVRDLDTWALNQIGAPRRSTSDTAKK